MSLPLNIHYTNPWPLTISHLIDVFDHVSPEELEEIWQTREGLFQNLPVLHVSLQYVNYYLKEGGEPGIKILLQVTS